MSTTLCTRCGAAVESPQLHERWHDDQDGLMQQIRDTLELLHAHSENLIERMHVIETAIDGGPEDDYDDGFNEVRFDLEAEAMRAAHQQSHGA